MNTEDGIKTKAEIRLDTGRSYFEWGKSTRADTCSNGLPIAERALRVNSFLKRLSCFDWRYVVVFFIR